MILRSQGSSRGISYLGCRGPWSRLAGDQQRWNRSKSLTDKYLTSKSLFLKDLAKGRR